jgi:hypothetical protein
VLYTARRDVCQGAPCKTKGGSEHQ